ncbi:hypothetical protein MASR2M48_13140 [Spirochaetota bacterium]
MLRVLAAAEPEHNAMRMNFSYSNHEQIEEGVKRLGLVVEEAIRESGKA